MRAWYRATVVCVLSVCAGLRAIASQADAPIGRYTASANVVVDNRTRLTWQRQVPSETFNHAAATSYCKGLLLEGGGWRLPTVLELQYLVDDTRENPAIDPTAFPDTPLGNFRTSTMYSHPDYPGWSWMVSFADGSPTPWVPGSADRVRCVR